MSLQSGIKSVAIVGPGAIGSVLAARLLKAGFSVALLGRTPLWAKNVRRHGIAITGKMKTGLKPGKFWKIESDPRKVPPCDALFLCVKSYDTLPAARSTRFMNQNLKLVLSLQNGMSHVSILKRIFGEKKTVFGAAYISANRFRPACVDFTGGNRIDLGIRRENKEAFQYAFNLLSNCGWKVRKVSSEESLLWTKLVLNAAINPLGALCGMRNGEIVSSPGLKEILLKAVGECERLAKRRGESLLYSSMGEKAIALCRETADNRNSMLQDLDAGRPTEIRSIVGPFLKETRFPEKEAHILSAFHRLVLSLQSS